MTLDHFMDRFRPNLPNLATSEKIFFRRSDCFPTSDDSTVTPPTLGDEGEQMMA
jgi:hypothetical protein